MHDAQHKSPTLIMCHCVITNYIKAIFFYSLDGGDLPYKCAKNEKFRVLRTNRPKPPNGLPVTLGVIGVVEYATKRRRANRK